MITSAEVFVQTLHAISQTIWVTVALTIGAFLISLVAGCFSVMLQLGGGAVGSGIPGLARNNDATRWNQRVEA